MIRLQKSTKLMLIGLALTLIGIPTPAGADQKEMNSDLSYSFSYTPVYQFETDLDGGGSFEVSRHYLNFDVMRPFNRNLRVGLGLGYEFENWDFDDLRTVGGATPWSRIHRPGLSLPIFYTLGDNWSLGITPAVEFSGESGAEIDESLIYGAVVSMAHPFGKNLYLGLGFGIFDQLEETAVFPFIVIDWKISQQFRIANPFRAGPAGPAGLELIYAPADNWEFGLGGAYRSYRFRLDDTGAVPNGIGENEFLVTFLRIGTRLGPSLTLDVAGGALFDGELSIEDADGNGIGDDQYDPAPFVALTIAGEF